MSEREFNEHARLYAAGHLSRRRFINRLVGGGVTFTAAVAFANAATASAAPGDRSSAAIYGSPGRKQPSARITPPPVVETPPGTSKAPRRRQP